MKSKETEYREEKIKQQADFHNMILLIRLRNSKYIRPEDEILLILSSTRNLGKLGLWRDQVELPWHGVSLLV